MKNYLEIAHISEMNVILLSELQDLIKKEELNEVKEIYCSIRNKYFENKREVTQVNFMHQGTFLGMAYISFVWLWEKIKNMDCKTEIIEKLESRFDFSKIKKECGPRNVQESYEKIRLIRNAISHGNVRVTEEHFQFYDKSSRENRETCLKMEWQDLGELVSMMISEINSFFLYIYDN